MTTLHLHYNLSIVENLTDDPEKEDDARELTRKLAERVERYATTRYVDFDHVEAKVDFGVVGSCNHVVIDNRGHQEYLVDFDPFIQEDLERLEIMIVDSYAKDLA